MPRRQLVRSDEVGAPKIQNDQLSQAQIRELSSRVTTQEDYLSLIISQLRIAQGGGRWTEQAPPAPVAPYSFVRNEQLDGLYDGQSLVYTVQFYFVPQTLELYFNGQLLVRGEDADYEVDESGGLNAGYDTVVLVAYPNAAPRPTDRMVAHYQRSGGPSPFVHPTP